MEYSDKNYELRAAGEAKDATLDAVIKTLCARRTANICSVLSSIDLQTIAQTRHNFDLPAVNKQDEAQRQVYRRWLRLKLVRQFHNPVSQASLSNAESYTITQADVRFTPTGNLMLNLPSLRDALPHDSEPKAVSQSGSGMQVTLIAKKLRQMLQDLAEFHIGYEMQHDAQLGNTIARLVAHVRQRRAEILVQHLSKTQHPTAAPTFDKTSALECIQLVQGAALLASDASKCRTARARTHMATIATARTHLKLLNQKRTAEAYSDAGIVERASKVSKLLQRQLETVQMQIKQTSQALDSVHWLGTEFMENAQELARTRAEHRQIQVELGRLRGCAQAQ